MGLKNINVFTVPAGYFDDFAKKVLDKINKPTAKIISGHFLKKIVRYAAAAAVISAIIIVGWFMNREQPTTVAKTEVVNELETSIKKVSDAEINKYVENNTVPLVEPANIVSGDVKTEDLKDMLAGVSDEDLKKYIQQNGLADENVN